MSLEGADYRISQIQGSNPAQTGLHLVLSSAHNDLLLMEAWAEGQQGRLRPVAHLQQPGTHPHIGITSSPNKIKASTYT